MAYTYSYLHICPRVFNMCSSSFRKKNFRSLWSYLVYVPDCAHNRIYELWNVLVLKLLWNSV